MGKKVVILRESQFNMLNKYINEGTIHTTMVKKIVKDLDSNYKKAVETYRDGNQYNNRKVFEVVVDGELISAKDLMLYIADKYSVSESFVKQLINDWCDNKIKDGELSKNVSMN
jgi:ribosomal protein L17